MALDRKALADPPLDGSYSQCSSSSAFTRGSMTRSATDSVESPQDGLPRHPSTHLQRFPHLTEPSSDVHTNGEADPQHPPPSHRPGSTHFDSLQDLLEQAGYKDTRVFTPQSNRIVDLMKSRRDSPSSLASSDSPTVTRRLGSTASAVSRRDLHDHETPRKTSGSVADEAGRPSIEASGGSWFSNFWKAAQGDSSSASSQGPTVKALSATNKEAHAPLQKGVRSSTSTPPKFARSLSSPPRPSNATSTRGARTLVSKSSTLSLWKASRAHKGTLANTASVASSSSPPRLGSKSSLGNLRGGGHAASVGVGISACDGGAAALSSLRRRASRTSLRKASGLEEEDDTDVAADGSTVLGGSTAAIEEWRRSLVSVKGPGQPAIGLDGENSDDVETPPKFKLKSVSSSQAVVSKDLFASLANPIVSSEAAVAPRNSECFKGPEAHGLRHAKSVEALRSALNQKKKPVLKTRHSIIGQGAPKPTRDEVPPVPALPSFSSDASIASLLKDKQATTVYREEMPDDVGEEANESPERHRGPPVLTLTSPSGVHSPQIVKLEGKEFDPRTFSPPVSVEGRMIISEERLPSQLRNFDALVSAISTRGRSRSRMGRKRIAGEPAGSNGIDSSSDGSRSAAESEASSDGGRDGQIQRRRTRRGCRAGKKHSRSQKNLAAAAATEAAVQSTSPGGSSSDATDMSLPPSSVSSMEDTSADAGKMTSCSAETGMLSFGSVSQSIISNDAKADEEDDDPFLAHVKAQEEAKRSKSAVVAPLEKLKKCRPSSSPSSNSSNSNSNSSQHRGIASILGGNVASAENDENDSSSRPSTPRSRKGRIVGRSRPVSQVSTEDRDHDQHHHHHHHLQRKASDATGSASATGLVHSSNSNSNAPRVIVPSAIPLRAMSSPSEDLPRHHHHHQHTSSWDSPTKDVAQRIKKMRSRRF